MDIFSVTKGIIVHQVNCQSVMGCGIALQIKQRFPKAFERYKAFKFKPGMIQLVEVGPDLYVCNLAGQDRYGRDKRYTEYNALRKGFAKLNVWSKPRDLPIFIPKYMGSANAGGDWETVSEIINSELKDCDVTICEKAGDKDRK